MIRHLSINNLMLIDKIEMDIGLGLCVLTGETGAGKSMILESLELLSGRRAKSNLKPEKGKKTIISALIDISQYNKIQNYLVKLDINFDDEIIIKRIIDSEGKSKSMINDHLVGLSTLREIAASIFEIHSQFSEQGLLNSSTHITTLDDFGNYKNELKKLSEIWFDYKHTEKKFLHEKLRFEENKSKRDNYYYDHKELIAFDPQSEEFKELEQTKKILQNSRKINESINEILNNFTREDPPGIEKLLSENTIVLDKIKDLLNQEALKVREKLNSIFLEVAEISKFFENFFNQDLDHSSLEKVDDRVSDYKKLAQKHSTQPDLLNLKLIEIEKKLDSTNESKKEIEKLSIDLELLKNKYIFQSEKITDLRKENAKALDQKINIEFPDLKLENAKFKTIINECEQNEFGKDKVIFNIRTNPKSKMGEIKNISSGGELCRIALAIKVTAEKENTSTMVFDEVDSGIGGAVSAAVGERLKKLGSNRQVLVVTHSPQVASQGANHFLVRKKIFNEHTSIDVLKIQGEQKIHEIARMLSGKHITNEAIQAAKKLIEDR